MKIILEFNLPEDRVDYLTATKGMKYFSMINNFEKYLKEIQKSRENSEEIRNKIEEIRKDFYEIFKNYDEDIS